MNKKILILGLNSFGGSTYANYLLEKKYSVIGLYHNNQKNNLIYNYNQNRKNLKKIKINFSSESSLKKINTILKKNFFDYIIDFASICMVDYSWENPSYYFKVNVESKIKLLQIIKNYEFKKYILISTPEVFGSIKKTLYENNLFYNPSTPYAISKSYQETYTRLICDKNKINFNICRFSNFYGPGQAAYRLIPRIIYSILFNKKIIIQGNGNAERSFIYSYDFCNGIYKVMKKSIVSRVYHFSNQEFLKIFDIYKIICKLMNVSYKNYFIYGPGRIHEDPIYRLNCKNTINDLKWKPKFNLEKGLMNTIKFYVDNKNVFKNYLLKFEKSKYI